MTDAPAARPARRAGGFLLWILVILVVIPLTVTGVLFLQFRAGPWPPLRSILALAFAVATIVTFLRGRPLRRACLIFASMFAALCIWFTLIPASNDRDWPPDVDRVASVQFDGDVATIANVRDFRYESLEDFQAVWETRTYDLAQIESTDLIFSYFGPRAIAHAMISFTFADGRHLAVSVEARKEVGEQYSPLRAFFKEYELIYIVADERDVIGVRTNYRLEDVYLFPLSYTPEESSRLLRDILDRAQRLSEEPRFYKTIGDNCTTALIAHMNAVEPGAVNLGTKAWLNGYIPDIAYARGTIPNDAPLEEVMQRYAVSDRAKSMPIDERYSEIIRLGIGPPAKKDH